MKLIAFTNTHIEPSRSAKRALLALVQAPRQVGSTLLPSLFDVSGYTPAASAFALAVGLEVYGLVNLHSLLGFPLAAWGSMLALDVAGGMMAHFGTGTKREAALRSAAETDEAKRARLASTPLWHSLVRALGYCTIVGLTFAKTAMLISTALLPKADQAPGVMVAQVATYFAVMLIHLRFTGNFIAGAAANFALWRDYRKGLRSGEDRGNTLLVTQHRIMEFTSMVPLLPVQLDGHDLQVLDAAKGHYALRTWGLLLDDAVSSMANAQPRLEQKNELALQCLRAQLLILDSNPVAVIAAPALLPSPASSTGMVKAKIASVAMLALMSLPSCVKKAPKVENFALHLIDAATTPNFRALADQFAAQPYAASLLPDVTLEVAKQAGQVVPLPRAKAEVIFAQSYSGAKPTLEQELEARRKSADLPLDWPKPEGKPGTLEQAVEPRLASEVVLALRVGATASTCKLGKTEVPLLNSMEKAIAEISRIQSETPLKSITLVVNPPQPVARVVAKTPAPVKTMQTAAKPAVQPTLPVDLPGSVVTPEYRALTANAVPLPIIRFKHGSSELTPESNASLAGLAKSLPTDARAKNSKLLAIGFSDDRNETGSEGYNIQLSKERAEAVAAELMKLGIQVHNTTGFGEQMPCASNMTEAGRSLNRRVELFLGPMEGVMDQR